MPTTQQYRKVIEPYCFQSDWIYRKGDSARWKVSNRDVGHAYLKSGEYRRKRANRAERISSADSKLRVKVNGTEVVQLEHQFVELFREINESKYIMDIPDDYDGSGSRSYKFEVWKSACKFVVDYYTFLYERTGRIPPVPKIYHGPDGSIDIHWDYDQFKLLINIEEASSVATFYGSYADGQEIEGSFNYEAFTPQLLPAITMAL